jgi:hypothetical protein
MEEQLDQGERSRCLSRKESENPNCKTSPEHYRGESQRAVPHELDFNLELLCTAVHLVIEAIVSRTTCHETCTTTFLRAVEIAPL